MATAEVVDSSYPRVWLDAVCQLAKVVWSVQVPLGLGLDLCAPGAGATHMPTLHVGWIDQLIAELRARRLVDVDGEAVYISAIQRRTFTEISELEGKYYCATT